MSESTHDSTELGRPPDDGPLIRARQRQRAAWQAGKRLTVEELVAAFPELALDRDAVLDLVYMEILHRDSRREKPTLAEYRNRFPELGDRLTVFFPA
jgi:hypothetical protein